MRSYKLDSVNSNGEITLISDDGTKSTTTGYNYFNHQTSGNYMIGSCLSEFGLWKDGRLLLTITVKDSIKELTLFEVQRIIDTKEFNYFNEIYDKVLNECVSFLRTHVSNIIRLVDKLWDEEES